MLTTVHRLSIKRERPRGEMKNTGVGILRDCRARKRKREETKERQKQGPKAFTATQCLPRTLLTFSFLRSAFPRLAEPKGGQKKQDCQHGVHESFFAQGVLFFFTMNQIYASRDVPLTESRTHCNIIYHCLYQLCDLFVSECPVVLAKKKTTWSAMSLVCSKAEDFSPSVARKTRLDQISWEAWHCWGGEGRLPKEDLPQGQMQHRQWPEEEA